MLACLVLAAYSAGRCWCCRWWWPRPPCSGHPLAGQVAQAGQPQGHGRDGPEIYTTLEETFRGIKIVKAFTMERQERRCFQEERQEVLPQGDEDRPLRLAVPPAD